MRKDGTKVKDAELMYLFVPYIMKQRNDAMNMITVDIPIEPMHTYINEKRKENFHKKGLSWYKFYELVGISGSQKLPILR